MGIFAILFDSDKWVVDILHLVMTLYNFKMRKDSVHNQ